MSNVVRVAFNENRFFLHALRRAPSICCSILHRCRGYVTVPERMDETLPVLIISKLLMRVVKAHARWRWRA
ncbi:hypothetical protein OKW09_004289 [Pseudomonas rhodesiae]|jgi:hypothetical protein|nr:hypothetical protein [Pseudomonas rhodesiae]MDF9772004.1 hypothetical protein [Pseudomonas rhodesiae]